MDNVTIEDRCEDQATINKVVGNISINCISPEARDLIDKIMEEWEPWEKKLKEMKPGYEPGFYAFTYWLVRWSGLINLEPKKVKWIK